MTMKSLSTTLLGATVFYAGILTLSDDFNVGLGMAIIGGILAVAPIWKAFLHSKQQAGPETFTAKTRKNKRKVHLKVVDDKKEDRPTYH
jgi:hypothetical protein